MVIFVLVRATVLLATSLKSLWLRKLLIFGYLSYPAFPAQIWKKPVHPSLANPETNCNVFSQK